MKILITSGATREPIDQVRFISNFSTGRTGAALCENLSAQGAQVSFLSGEGSAAPTTAKHLVRFSSFIDLNSSLERILREESFDAVIHLAAVSDYSIQEILVDHQLVTRLRKITSEAESVELKLVPNFKILSRIRSYSSNPHIKVVAFKLTDTSNLSERESAIDRVFKISRPDLVVHNDMHEIRQSKRKFTLHQSTGRLREIYSIGDLGQTLFNYLSGEI